MACRCSESYCHYSKCLTDFFRVFRIGVVVGKGLDRSGLEPNTADR